MGSQSRAAVALLVLFLACTAAADAFSGSQTLTPSFPKAISDLKEAVVRGLGSQAEGLEISGFDVRDAVIGQSLGYEFHIEVGKQVIPIKLLEDANRWQFVDLASFFKDTGEEGGDGKELAEMGKVPESKVYPVLDAFQLAGPMELWIQDGDDMRLALPHDVDAGVLRKVTLSDGAVVTIKGARSISLRHPIELPLPFNRTNYKGNKVATGLLTLAEALRQASRSSDKPLVSLRIVGPTSLTSSSSSSSLTFRDRLKLKRLGPGAVELSSSVPAIMNSVEEEPNAPRLWPFTSFNGSDLNLRGFEELLASVLGDKAKSKGSFRLVKAEVSAQTYIKLSFALTKRLTDKNVDWSGFPEWKTRPEKATSRFEVLARLEDNGKVVPERIAEVQPYEVQETVLPSVQMQNITMSRVPIIHPAPVFFTL